MAVAVIVHKAATCAPSSVRVQQPRGLGDIRKSAVAVVAIKAVLSEIGAENVLESVVVVISDANTVSPAGGMQSGLFSHVGKRSIAVVFVQAVRGFGRSAIESGSAEQKNVDPAIIVVIDKGAAAAVRLKDIFLAVDAAVDGRLMQSSGLGNIYEMRIEGPARTWGARLRLHASRGNALLLTQQGSAAGGERRTDGDFNE